MMRNIPAFSTYRSDLEMCDTLVASSSITASGAVLFGKNSDREFNEAQHLEQQAAASHGAGSSLRLTYREIPQVRGTYAVLLSKPHWIWGAEMGANEHGLVIGNEALFSRIPASFDRGVIGMDYVRLALERSRCVDEAVHVITSLLREYGQSGQCGYERKLAYHNAYLLADPNAAAVLETVEREWVLRRVEDVYAISNVMTVEQEFELSSDTLLARAAQLGTVREPLNFKAAYEDSTQVASGTYRRARALELLRSAQGRLEEPAMFRILRDHEEGPPIESRPGGPRICMHHRDSPLGHTTGSWVSHLSKGRVIHWVTGTAAPCTGVFKPLLTSGELPSHGSRPGASEEATSLWWRHERLRRYLERGPDLTLSQYSAERDALEARFLDAMSGAESEGGLQPIVESCWRDALDFENRWLARVGAA
jgi:dipeptidase